MSQAEGKKREAIRQKSFMSRVSSILLPKKKHSDAKTKLKSQSDLLKRKKSAISADMCKDHVSLCSISGGHAASLESEEPGYSSICDPISSRIDIQKNGSPPPVVPPKAFDDLYATVKKKKTTEVSCNTEDLNFYDGHSDDASGDEGIPLGDASDDFVVGKNESVVCNLLTKLEASSDDTHSIEISQRQPTQKLKSQRPHSSRHHRNKQRSEHKEYTTHDDSQLLNLPHHLHTSQHKRHAHMHKDKSAAESMQANVLHNVMDEKSVYQEAMNKIKQKHQDELLNLQQEMQDTDKENEVLRARIANLLEQEQKWKQEITKARLNQQQHLNAVENNAELNRRIAKLETDTKQEVQLLCHQINTLKHEKELTEQRLQTLEHDYKALQKKYNQLCEENKSMISVERHVRSLEENRRFLEEMKTKHEEDIKKLNEMYATAQGEKNSLSVQSLVMKEEQKRLEAENRELKQNRSEIYAKNNELAQELHDMKLQRDQALDKLTSTLTMAEKFRVERDALLEQAELQNQQRNMMHTTLIEHTINIGRLKEYMMNIRQRMDEEIRNVVMSKQNKELDYNNMKESYERQLDFLRRKILQQNGTLDILGKEKRQLEVDLANLWEAALSPNKETQKIQQWNHKTPYGKLNNS